MRGIVRAMQPVLLVVNPGASSVSPETAARVESALGGGVEVAWTERRGHATELVREADAQAVVVFGGDGVFNEALNGLPDGLPIGLVPGGGSSVLPRALGLPDDPEAAARRVAEALRAGRGRTISLGRVNGRRFAFAAALGFPAEVVRRVDELGRGRRGRRPPDRVFLTTGLRILAERRGRLPPEIEVEGHGRTAFALVANGDPYTYLWRLPVRAAPLARWDGGLDVVGPRSVGPFTIPRLLLAALTGRTPRARGVLYLDDVEAIELRADRPLPLQVDGEDLGDVDRAVFASEPNAAKILI
ncbi:MAG TPA: diacylglycerol kinase family protein [Gaiellaceae bacterium]|nr:diacylglycerol kinase family protein [Gaiellaceae bacterium]